MRSLYALLFCLCGLISPCIAQVFIMDGTNISSCEGVFVDPGGLEQDYPNDTTLSVQICSDEAVGSHVSLYFELFELGDGDTLRFFDGPDENAVEIIPPGSHGNGQAFGVQATAANESGCLFLMFSSNDTIAASGWQAQLSCLPACQPIQSSLLVDGEPISSWFPYVLVCEGEALNWSGVFEFPQNNLTYQQSEEQLNFQWQFGDGVSSNAANPTHIYSESGQYTVRLAVTDQFGCPNISPSYVTVGVLAGPELEVNEDIGQNICIGDSITLLSVFNDTLAQAGVSISIPPIRSIHNQHLATDPLAIPDGSGAIYQSTIHISQYPPGATLQSIDELDSIMIALEHSYAGDLDIEVICPNESSVLIVDYPSGLGSTNFGEPFASSPVDNQSVDLTPGIPYTYAFQETAENGTLREFDENAPIYTYTTVHSTTSGQSYTYTDTYFPPGQYEPEESFTELLGCPLNGEWTLQIQDNLGLDNGWIFSWGIYFDSTLLPPVIDTFSIANWYWEDHPDIVFQDEDNAIIVPSGVGYNTYNFFAESSLACPANVETPFTMLVYPEHHPFCQGNAPSTPVGRNNNPPWPNPFQNSLNLEIVDSEEPSQVLIYDGSGLLIYQQEHRNSVNIDTQSWPSGIYFVKYYNSSGDESGAVMIKS